MHFLMIHAGVLKSILETIVIDKPENFVFHVLCSDTQNEEQSLIFQANYNNYFYTSFIIDVSKLMFFDFMEFQPIVMNYEQCVKLVQLCNMFEPNVSVGFDLKESEGCIEVVVSHSNIKVIFIVDTTIDHDPIIPPDHSLIVPYINLNSQTLLNVVKLSTSPKFYTPIKVDSKKSRIIVGDLIQSIIQLKGMDNTSNSEIDINPDSVILFLHNLIHNLKIKQIEIKVDSSIAFTIHSQIELGEIYYYSTHEITN